MRPFPSLCGSAVIVPARGFFWHQRFLHISFSRARSEKAQVRKGQSGELQHLAQH
jgi:hypothetical protein